MTVNEIVYKLKNDFPFLVSIIVKNNPDAVRNNLSQMIDANYENTESMINAILDLQEGGQLELVQKALKVPFLPANASTSLVMAWEQVKAEAKAKSSSAMRGDGEGFASWSGGMFDAIGTIGSAWLGGQQQGSTGSGLPVYTQPVQQPKKSYTVWIVVGVLVVLSVVAILVLRKR